MAKKEALQKTSGSLFDSSWNELSYAQSDVDEQVSKRLTPWSVVALAFGVLSLLTFVNVAFAFFSVVAALFALAALATIARSGGEVTGRKLACLGLALALMTAIGGPVRRAVYRMEFERQAGEFCEAWFDAVKAGDICQVRQMENPYWKRATIVSHQDEIDYFIRNMGVDDEPHYGTHAFLANPTLLTLYTLGDRAKHSYYATTSTLLTGNAESTERVYAVTCEPDPYNPNTKKQTFFFRLVCNRTHNETEDGEKLVGWSTISSDLNPMELDENGRPVWEKINR